MCGTCEQVLAATLTFLRLNGKMVASHMEELHAAMLIDSANISGDPALLERQFTYREIYPPELVCHDDGLSGLHSTPLDGATLPRLAVDSAGFGGHTPLFNAVVSCATMLGRQRDAATARTLLDRGARRNPHARLRKFLDWREARDVTPIEWARSFPEFTWVNREAVRLLNET